MPKRTDSKAPLKIPSEVAVAQEAVPASKKHVGILYFILNNESIDEPHVSQVRNAVEKATVEEIYLVIDSDGGVPYSAVRIMRILKKRFKKIWGVVPHKAMSAATLMLLGTHGIYMSEESQIGPIDLPMEHPTDGSMISALDVVQALSSLESTAKEFATSMYRDLRTDGFGERIPKERALKIALEHAHTLVLPLIKKVDPYHRQKALRKLKIGRWYAIDLLVEGMMKNDLKRADRAASNLVMSFPDHSYSVFREDARDMCMLEIIDSEGLELWDVLCNSSEKYLNAGGPAIIYNEIEI